MSRAVTHSASVVRAADFGCQAGCVLSRNAALTTFSVPGIFISRTSGSSPPGRRKSISRCDLTPEKKAAKPQNCSRFHSLKGWLWHWAHSTLRPRKMRAVPAARFSALNSLAVKNAVVLGAPEPPKLKPSPWLASGAVKSSRVISS